MSSALVLLDIDGTLLTTDGAGREAFAAAIRAVFGWEDDLGWVSFAGATDLGLLRTICRRHGRRPTRAEAGRFFRRMEEELARRLTRERVRVLPGARRLVVRLRRRADVSLALLTGNSRGGARIKLERAGLDVGPLRGAFGDEMGDRRRLARAALRRVGEAGAWRAVWVVGDTPADIRAALAIGARSLAVATGHYTVNELRRAGATLAVRRLTEVSDLAFLR
ncbi:MAG: haloacid dehalogenase-like hydrolase [Kiritimatiellae bacterium]|nr:haloacid dehalogenase-like hydrolase [Kiritimatiellia bacterium]